MNKPNPVATYAPASWRQWSGSGPAFRGPGAAMLPSSRSILRWPTSASTCSAGRAIFLSYAAELNGCGDEDTLAFGRDERQFSNLLLVEQPNGNFADTIARQFFIDVWHVALFSRTVNSRDTQLAAIAAKGLKEVRYHQRFSRGWLERLGNGTELSNRKNAAGGRQSVALHRRTVPCR